MFWEEVAEPCPHGVEQRAYRYWTGREVQVLRRCHAEGGAWARRAGVALLRTPRAVRGQAKRMGLSKRAGPRRFTDAEVERAARALELVRAAREAADGVAAELGIARKAMSALVWRHRDGQE